MPTLEEVAFGMGELLAKLHWAVGINGKDMELVLSGNTLHGTQCYALDFNQVRAA